jgi:hypothetical protein
MVGKAARGRDTRSGVTLGRISVILASNTSPKSRLAPDKAAR